MSARLDLLDLSDKKIRTLHYAWFAFFLTFVVWFSHAPLMATMRDALGLSDQQVKTILILNVALTIPARIIIGILVDRFGPRLVYTSLLVVSSFICFGFSLAQNFEQLAIARFGLGLVGAGFVIGIRLVGEWFPARQVGLAEGIYGGWGNFGSAAAAMSLPTLAMIYGGENGWRLAIASTGVVTLVFSFFFYRGVRNTPKGSTYFKPKRSGGLEVTSRGDFFFYLIMNVPMYLTLGVLTWKLSPANLGMLGDGVCNAIYAGLALLYAFQARQIYKVNADVLHDGVPEIHRYRFKQVAVLDIAYLATFGSELAVVSMLPLFFLDTFEGLSPVTAGLFASGFAFMNLAARPGGGWLSDHFGRRRTLSILIGGLAVGYWMLSQITGSWPLGLAVVATMCCSFFVQAGEGAVFAMVPLVKRRMTGQIAGMAGAYGNVGAVLYLTVLSFVDYTTFFMVIAASATVVFLAVQFMDEPEGHMAEVREDGTVELIEVALMAAGPIEAHGFTMHEADIHFDAGLEITAGQASDAGVKDVNEDSMALFVPDGPALALKGVVAAIADGVSSAEAGREAAETCVQNFATDYYSTPESWSTPTSARAVLTALNRWLYGQSHGPLEAHRGYVCTLSILVVKSCTAHIFHVGDTRIHRIRDGRLERLTIDHATRITDSQTYLSRAMGMDARLEVDYRKLEVREGDLFFLSTDGIHDQLTEPQLAAEISAGIEQDRPFESICQRLVAAALDAGSQDNVTCQLIRIDALGDESADDVHQRLTALPFPPPLDPGSRVDGLRIEEEIHASTRSQLYRVTEESTGRSLVMKTPSVNYDDDPAYIERFVMEPWIGRRISNPHVVQIVETGAPQSFLYYLMEWIDGVTLEAWIRAHPQPQIGLALDLLEQIVDGLRALHRKETWHQDLKPANVMIDSEGTVRIVDFGSCRVEGIEEITVPIERDIALGTASHSAPEARIGQAVGKRSDLFALGSIAYELLTGHLPYGEKTESALGPEDFERLEYTPSYHHNPMIPVWLDGALKTAVQPRPNRRYRTLSEFVYDLRHPNPVFARSTPRPLIERDPVRFWQGVAALTALGWAATLWWLLR